MPRIISSTTTFDYNYDFPMPPTSSLINPSLPTRKPAHVLRRPRSSSPTYLTPHFPHHSSKYLPSTRAAEVSRLLDPAYANPQHSQGSGSTSSNSPLSVFVDHYGDLHDPEYRHFPVVATRPKWEHGDDDLIDEEDEDVFGPSLYRPSSRKPTPTTTFRPSYAYSSYHYDVPHPSPSSYESNALVNEDIDGSPFADELSEKKECAVRRIRHRYSKSSHTVEEKEALASAENAENSAAPGADYAPGEFGDHDWTPTCTQSLRREWQAITLRVRFSLFRMKRKMKRRLGTG